MDDTPSSSSRHYSDLARELKQFPGWVIGVLHDAAYAGLETPASLRYEDIAAAWGSRADVKVVPLDANQIRSYEILFRGKMDVLVFPYGSVYPMDAFGVYSGHTFNHFLRRGGAVLTTGGAPFMQQAGSEGELISNSFTPQEVYDRWVASFGVKVYESPTPPSQQRVNRALLPSLPAVLPAAPSRWGVVVNNSSHAPRPTPPHGNVFLERYPARQVIPLISGVDAFGAPINTAAVLAQDFEVGSRMIYFTHEAEPHPLSPRSGYFAGLMDDLLALLTNRVTAAEVAAEYARYRAGEAVRVRAEIDNHAGAPQPATLRLSIVTGEQTVFTAEETMSLPAGQSVAEWTWAPESFEADEYLLRLEVVREGRVVSSAENGLVVWQPATLAHGPTLGLREHYFTVDGRGAFITGTNYCESTRGEAMWYRPSVSNLIRDHQQMAACGLNWIRPHYHHLKWFKDYLLYQHGRLFPFYQSLAAVDDPQPDERVWRIWDAVIYLSQKYGLVYNGDLFTLVPEEMGDPRGWFGTVEAVYDREKRPAQKTFLGALEERYRDVPGISWDLFNEPSDVSDADVAEWAADLETVFEELGSRRLITVGGPTHIGATVDYDSPHGRFAPDFVNRHALPVLLQELHLDRPEPLAAERQQAEDVRYYLVLAVRNGLAGVCPWSWTRQMRLWQDSYEHHYSNPMEKWDDRLGLHTHDDGTLKLAGQVFKDIAWLLRSMDLQRYDLARQRVLTAQGELAATVRGEPTEGDRAPAEPGLSLMHTRGDDCLAGMAWEQIEWQGRALVAGPAGAYVYFYASGGAFDGAPELWVKSEGAGRLTVARGGAKTVELVDGGAGRCRVLAAVPVAAAGEQTPIQTTPEMARYWLRLRFD